MCEIISGLIAAVIGVVEALETAGEVAGISGLALEGAGLIAQCAGDPELASFLGTLGSVFGGFSTVVGGLGAGIEGLDEAGILGEGASPAGSGLVDVTPPPTGLEELMGGYHMVSGFGRIALLASGNTQAASIFGLTSGFTGNALGLATSGFSGDFSSALGSMKFDADLGTNISEASLLASHQQQAAEVLGIASGIDMSGVDLAEQADAPPPEPGTVTFMGPQAAAAAGPGPTAGIALPADDGGAAGRYAAEMAGTPSLGDRIAARYNLTMSGASVDVMPGAADMSSGSPAWAMEGVMPPSDAGVPPALAALGLATPAAYHTSDTMGAMPGFSPPWAQSPDVPYETGDAEGDGDPGATDDVYGPPDYEEGPGRVDFHGLHVYGNPDADIYDSADYEVGPGRVEFRGDVVHGTAPLSDADEVYGPDGGVKVTPDGIIPREPPPPDGIIPQEPAPPSRTAGGPPGGDTTSASPPPDPWFNHAPVDYGPPGRPPAAPPPVSPRNSFTNQPTGSERFDYRRADSGPGDAKQEISVQAGGAINAPRTGVGKLRGAVPPKNVPDAQKKAFLRQVLPGLLRAVKRLGLPPSRALWFAAQAAKETGWGPQAVGFNILNLQADPPPRNARQLVTVVDTGGSNAPGQGGSGGQIPVFRQSLSGDPKLPPNQLYLIAPDRAEALPKLEKDDHGFNTARRLTETDKKRLGLKPLPETLEWRFVSVATPIYGDVESALIAYVRFLRVAAAAGNSFATRAGTALSSISGTLLAFADAIQVLSTQAKETNNKFATDLVNVHQDVKVMTGEVLAEDSGGAGVLTANEIAELRAALRGAQ